MESFEGVKQKFDIRDVHHIELYAADATSTSHWCRSGLRRVLPCILNLRESRGARARPHGRRAWVQIVYAMR